jgi:hypothetical protein
VLDITNRSKEDRDGFINGASFNLIEFAYSFRLTWMDADTIYRIGRKSDYPTAVQNRNGSINE